MRSSTDGPSARTPLAVGALLTAPLRAQPRVMARPTWLPGLARPSLRADPTPEKVPRVTIKPDAVRAELDVSDRASRMHERYVRGARGEHVGEPPQQADGHEGDVVRDPAARPMVVRPVL